MSKDEVFVRKELTKVYPQLKKNMKKVCGSGYDQWGDDLLSVAITFFLEKPLHQQLKTIEEGKLENFITWIANIQLKSNSSKYYSVYRKPLLAERELFGNMKYTYGVNAQGFNEELMNCVEKVLSDIEPAWATYFVQIVYDNLPLQDIAKEVHLSMATVKRKIDDITKLIQVKCQDCI